MPKQTPKPRSLRAQAFEESNYPIEVEGTRCVEIRVPNADEFMAQLAGVIALAGKRFNYQNKDVERAKIIAEMWQAAYLETGWESCMNCEELIECLTPFFTEVLAKLDAIQSTTNSIAETTTNIFNTQNNNLARLPTTPEVELSGIYAGALELVRQMDKNNRKYYAEAEASFVDNASEALSIVLELFPKFRDAPYDESFELGNAYFENQVAAYNTDYPDFEVPAAFDLYCRIKTNDEELTIEVWGDWLFNVTSVTVDPNAAGKVFTRYSPLRQTFLNQVAAFFNREASLQSYFEDLWQVYYAGTKSPVPLPDGYVCPEEWTYRWNLLDSQSYTSESHESSASAIWTPGVGYYVAGSGFNYGAIFYDTTRIPADVQFQRAKVGYSKTHSSDSLSPDYIWLISVGSLGQVEAAAGTDLEFEVTGEWTMGVGDTLFPQIASNQPGFNTIIISTFEIGGFGIPPVGLTGGAFV